MPGVRDVNFGLKGATHPVCAAIFQGRHVLIGEECETAGELHDDCIVRALPNY